MKRIIITESRFPGSHISDVITSQKDEVVSLDGCINVPAAETLLAANTTINTWKIWTDAYHLAQMWYRPNGEDATECEGISFGKIVEIEMWYYWRSVLERIEIIKYIIKSISPDEIYLATLDNHTIKQMITGLGSSARIAMISPPLKSWLSAWRDAEFIRERLKRWEIDRHARLLALGLVGSIRHHRIQSDIEVLGLLEQPGNYLADSILPVLSHFPESAVLLMDHRHQSKVSQVGQRSLYFSDFVIRHLGSLPRYRRIFDERWRAFRDLFSVSLPNDDLNLWPIARERLYQVFRRKFPIIGVEIESAREILLEYRVKSLLLTSDAHHGGRLFTLIANQLGIPSLVVQHGATLGEWGYVPLYATCFAAWGNISKQWLVERGVSPERIIVTGQPRLDNLTGKNLRESQEEFRSRLGLPASGYLLLWAMDPITPLQNKEVFEQLIKVVATLPWLYLVIRPHPGIQQLSWIVSIVKERERVVVSSPQESLYEVLNAVDGVVVQGSTVGIEAMLFGKPVILFQPNTVTIRGDTLYPDEAVINVATAEELCQSIEELHRVKTGSSIDHHAQVRDEFIRQYFCALDGKSTQRVAQALSELMSGCHSLSVKCEQ